MGKCLLLHLILIFSCAGGAAGQEQVLREEAAGPGGPASDVWRSKAVQSLDVENGLPQGYVNGILQDSTGFIWLGTRDGLARYDGYTVETFHYDPQDSATIASDVIQTIYPDRENKIWILYENGGVDVLDPVTWEITHIRKDGPLGWLLDGREHRPFVLQQDSRKRYWVVSSDLKQLRHFTLTSPAPVEVPLPMTEQIVALREGQDGEMYLCTDYAFYRIERRGLHKIADLPLRRTSKSDRISEMEQDKLGRWVIVNNGHLEILERTGAWKAVSLPAPNGQTPFYFIERSPAGELYVSAANRVFRLNADDSLSPIWLNPDTPGDIPAMMVDRSNVLWLGTNTFGARLIPLSSGGFHSYPYVHGFVRDVLVRYFDPVPSDLLGRGLDPYLLRYASDRQEALWMIGTPFLPGSAASVKAGQLLRLTGRNPASTRFDADSLRWLQLAFDRRNTCWGVVLDENQDTVLVKAGHGARSAVAAAGWRPAFEDISYLTALEDRLCIVYKKGIELYDPESGKSVCYKSEDAFGNVPLLMAVPDPREPAVLWITSLGCGLVRFDTHNGRVRAFTTKDGIPSNSVYAVVADKRGRFWCSSNKGIFRFDPASQEVLSFVAKDGLQGNEFNRYHFLQSPEGYIFFGGTRGWTAFHPDSVYVDSYQPETAITNILVNNRPVPEMPEWKGIAVTALQRLRLSHDQNFITFTFAGLQFANSDKLQYRYQLDGLDEDWVEAGHWRIASYTNLPPGEYIFKVNSSNEAGTWSPHIKEFSLMISPPWWNTWWARGLYAIMLAGCVYAYYRYRAGRVLVQEQIRRQQEEAKQLRAMDEMKSRFFSNITHEFRTPLSLIIAPLEEIGRESTTPPPVRKRISGIQRNARQLLRLINQLLDMSKIESGNMKVSLSRGDLGQFTAGNLNGFREQARMKKIRLKMRNDLPGEYDFDSEKWQKILYNLVSNAIRFSPEGGQVTVSLRASESAAGPHAAILEVSDCGEGIPENQQHLIFDRFYQVDDSRTRRQGGTGIGLALVKELTTLMKGLIEVESAPGEGALFRVTIPVAKASMWSLTEPVESRIIAELRSDENVTEEFHFAAAKKGNNMSMDRASPLVLLAEDNEELNSFIADSLGRDYRVISASNGREALRMAEEQLPDLVISDIMMPAMDGYALCDALKGSIVTDHIAVILLSAKASHESVIKGLRNHADDYMFKPFHIDELHLRVHNLLERQRKLREHYHRQLTAPKGQLSVETVSDMFLKRLYALIEEHLEDPGFDVGALAGRLAISRRTLNRKLSALVNLSASEVMKQYRLKRAAQLLLSGLNVSETAYRVGFASVSYFSNSFKTFHGMVPSAYGSQPPGPAEAGRAGPDAAGRG